MLPQLLKLLFKLLIQLLPESCQLLRKHKLRLKPKLRLVHKQLQLVMLLQLFKLRTQLHLKLMPRQPLRPPSHIQELNFSSLKVKQLNMPPLLQLLPMLFSRKKSHGLKWPQPKDKLNLPRTRQKRRQRLRKKPERTQPLMKTENTSKPLLKLKPKQLNSNKCWLQVKQQLNRKFN